MLYLDDNWESVNNRLIGKELINSEDKQFIVTEAYYNYKKQSYKFKIRFTESGFSTIAHRSDINKGLIRDRLSPAVCGVASIGYGSAKENPREYRLWVNIIRRCYSIESDVFKNYGQKGVTVCDRWLRFDYFLEDLPHIEGYCEIKFNKGELELDKDIKQWELNKDQRVYSLGSCIFVSRQENDSYREYSKSHQIRFLATKDELEEEFESIKAFCNKYNLNNSSVSRALKLKLSHKGWNFERIDK